ncbi:hypothetical protein ACP26L_36110 (plasmid) [Paenibacillus sp. S-38]|uniref:hypothetical protein n=1 Tax=Paenibacillus sp. S-38 TaxID=3416710 RepID=UPI003CEE0CD8
MTATMTHHGKQRTKDRMGLSKKLADKKAQEALDFGASHAETSGRLNKYFTSLYFRHQTANNIRIYHRYVYLFAGTTVITILHLPKDLIAAAEKAQKRKAEGVEAQCS